MQRRSVIRIGVVGLLAALAIVQFAIAQQPRIAPVQPPKPTPTSQPSPAELIRRLRENDAVVNKAKSVWMKVMDTYTDDPNHRDSTWSTVIAFDEKRIFSRHKDNSRTSTFENIVSFDGRTYVNYRSGVLGSPIPPLYTLGNSPPLHRIILLEPWPASYIARMIEAYDCADPQRTPDPPPRWDWDMFSAEIVISPTEDFKALGIKQFHEVNCIVLETPILRRRLYFNAENLRLAGLSRGGFTNTGRSSLLQVLQELAAAHGKTVNSFSGFLRWYAGLSRPTRAEVSGNAFRKAGPLIQESSDYVFSEYKEIAPGCFMPMLTTVSHEDSNATNVPRGLPPSAQRLSTSRILDVKINQPLPVSDFKVEYEEGATVLDNRFGPQFSYTYSKTRTEDELRKMAAAAQARTAARGDRSGR